MLELSTAHATVKLIELGATLMDFELVESAQGRRRRIILGHVSEADTVRLIQGPQNPYLGIIGRTCNRIADGRFSLDGAVRLEQNNGCNNLHGGPFGFDQKPWTVAQASDNAVRFTLRSEHMDQGFPGSLFCSAKYTLSEEQTGAHVRITLKLDLSATSEAKDIRTIANLTNHTYWNLNCQGHILDHVLEIPHQVGVLDLNEHQIPTGHVSLEPLLDFRKGKRIGKDISQLGKGYDHFCLLSPGTINSKSRLAAKLTSGDSKITMRMLTDAMGFQLYTGNWLNCTGHCDYKAHSALALEPSAPPDAIHHEQWRDAVILSPGDATHQSIVYQFDFREEPI